MSQSKESVSPLLDIQDALAVASVINRFALSFEPKKALSIAEARAIFVLLVRCISALLEAFPDELQALLERAILIHNGESEPNDSN